MLPGRKMPAVDTTSSLSLRPGRLQPMPPTAPQPTYDQVQVPAQVPPTPPYEPCAYYSPHIPTANMANFWSPRSSTKSASSSPVTTTRKSGGSIRQPYRAPVRGGGYTSGGDRVQLVRPISREGTGRVGAVYGRGPRPETPVNEPPLRATLSQGLQVSEPGRAADSMSPTPKVIVVCVRAAPCVLGCSCCVRLEPVATRGTARMVVGVNTISG